MKRSGIIPGVSVLMLAAIGAFAAARNYTQITYYYQSGGLCLGIQLSKECSTVGSTCREIIGSGPAKQLYSTKLDDINCDVPLALDE